MPERLILEVEGLEMQFGGERRFLGRARPLVRAVAGVSLTLRENEMLGIVGESGCGKSTLGRTILGIQRETAGSIRLDGRTVSGLGPRDARRARRDIQYLHQDAAAALDPWWSVAQSLEEPLIISGMRQRAVRETRIERIFTAVGLEPALKRRYPHELSGGQVRRVTLARVLVLAPRIVILDEPTAGLDLSVQATVLALIQDLKREFHLTYLFISHDLSVVRQVCDRVAIMYLGRIVEVAETRALFEAPTHPYTRMLLEAAPRLTSGQDLGVTDIHDEPPSPSAVPSGCAFRTRCPYAVALCGETVPKLELMATSREVACHRWRELAAAPIASARPASPANA